MSTIRCNSRKLLLFSFIAFCTLFLTRQALAYYDTAVCSSCHGAFNGGTYNSLTSDDPANWGMSLMNGHITKFGLSCSDCHSSSGFTPVMLNSSSSGVTCASCHGRQEDVRGGIGAGAGLRQRHFRAGITTCASCHSDNNPAFFTPAPESTPPQTFIAKGIDPCADAAFGNAGLDNDGDGLRDGADPDCQATQDLPPVPVISADSSGLVGATLSFDGSGSTDDGSIIAYNWSFGDGLSANGMTVTHAYASTGTFTVTLEVCDDAATSQCATATHTVTITAAPVDNPPSASISGPSSGLSGATLTFDGSGSSDDGSIVSYAWDVNGTPTASGINMAYTFASAGSYTVSLTVCDDASPSQCDTASHSVSITDTPVDNPPTAVISGPGTGSAGDTLNFDGSGSTDDNGIVSYAWTVNGAAAGNGMTLSHTFASAGTSTVGLTVCDNASPSQCHSTSHSVSIAPVVTGGGESLYLNNCAFCHGDATTADPAPVSAIKVAGARSCSIQGAIYGTSVYPNGVPGMQFLQGMLNQDQLQQVADYLNSFAVSGQQRYTAACSGCHGLDGSGGAVNENVRGASAGEIMEAIHDERVMNFLSCLPADDLQQMAAFLSGNTGGGGANQGGDDDEHSARRDEDEERYSSSKKRRKTEQRNSRNRRSRDD